ncbi:MAG TPA: redoxin domain-containing protein [Solirubrobacteraceae bacterium]|nr:redoxin domain-containing protein [Solirubrobacteraceae bacterium]
MSDPSRRKAPAIRRLSGPAAGLLVLLAIALGLAGCGGSSRSGTRLLADNPNVDQGSSLGARPAPNFTLIDEHGRRISLRAYRGKVVVLSFNDSQCTTICPLTTQAMLDAKRSLGAAGRDVQLLGVDANPRARAVHDVLSYTELHGMLGQWHFLTGSLRQLHAVWHDYGVGVDIQRGVIDHTAALFVIDRQGRMQKLYLTTQSYAAVPQLGQVLAHEISSLLPGRPPVSTRFSYATRHGITPNQDTTVPAMGGGVVNLGPGRPRLLVFFATWDTEVMNLRRDLRQLDVYAAAARAGRLPALTAVDEASVEPSPTALSRFISSLGGPLGYPVALDLTGRLADGYEVQDEPWFVLVSRSGRILWTRDASTTGWPSPATLESQVKAALARVPASGSTAAQLSGSPAPLAALHRQGSQLVGGRLVNRLRALHGYPVVVNIWGSWCIPCQREFPVLAGAANRYGKQVAFLGADYNDQPGNARSFLATHRVSYPSYTVTPGGLQSLLPGGIQGTPTTFFLNRSGKVVYVHTGPYFTQGTLDQDIQTYALKG